MRKAGAAKPWGSQNCALEPAGANTQPPHRISGVCVARLMACARRSLWRLDSVVHWRKERMRPAHMPQWESC